MGASARPPNLILIMVDQLAAGWLPAYGHPVVQAPNITRLARDGVVFESAYCPSPLCLPSRAGMLTGKLPSRTGAYDNAAELPASSPRDLAEGVTSPAVMIRPGPHKFVSCGTDPDQLYDLARDPHERVNLAESSANADLRRGSRDALAARWDVGALEQRVLESQRERHLVAQALATGRRTSWDYQPRVDAATQYVRSGADMYELQRRARLDSGDPPSRA